MLLNVVTVVTELRLLRGKFARRMRCSYGAVHVPLMNFQSKHNFNCDNKIVNFLTSELTGNPANVLFSALLIFKA